VVDDQPIQRQLLAALLMPLGFVVQEAASGREALDIVARQRPDTLLLDMSMDDLDGWQTAELIRGGEAGVPDEALLPIVFVSANMFENRPEQMQALRCQGFVGKPVAESELLEVLARSLQLEWVHESAPRPLPGAEPAPPAVPACAGCEVACAGSAVLPAAFRAELVQLARLGHSRGLQARMHDLVATRPELAPVCAPLLARADAFDFAGLIARLKDLDDDDLA